MWNKAAEDFARVHELDPARLGPRAMSAQIRLLLEDTDRYRSECAKLLQEAANRDPQAGALAQAAWVCLMAPDLAHDLRYSKEAIDQLYDEAKTKPDEPWMSLVTHIIDIRRGNPTPEPKEAPKDSTLLQQASVKLWNAIALIQLNRRREARDQDDEAQKLIRSARAGGNTEEWWRDPSCGILSREVEERLE